MLLQDRADVVHGDVDGICDSRNREDTLELRRMHQQMRRSSKRRHELTSVEPGSICSLACRRAPEAS